MKSSKKNQRTMAADEESSMKSREHDLGEETLEMVQGGELNPADMAQASHIVNQVTEHHGVSTRATALNYTLVAAGTFGLYTAGSAITKAKNKKN